MNDENPYRPPEARIADVFVAGDAGGSLESGIQGDYDFQIGAVIKESWQRTHGLKAAYWGGMIMFLVIMLGVMLLIIGMGGFISNLQFGFVGEQLATLLMTAAIYPFMAGIAMMGVNRSVDHPVAATQVFGYFDFVVTILIAGFLVTLFTNIGFVLLIIPGVYLMIAYALTLPLVTEKKLAAWQAMESSRKAVSRRWFKIFGLFLLMGLIMMIGAMTVIGLFWVMPMLTAMLGILYRIIFGVELARGPDSLIPGTRL